mmetsp:Transcript_27996/g.37368  ORF Transcript_27996/g.37368 Transcript_27996/m.37368 type:complete len:409 (+) Transcript_27996:246-1472(+)
MTDAFSEPLPLNDMIRITFVTGAGKLGRQKYDEGAAKALTSTLRNLGFEEDRGASCVVECAGSFKLQHDTGKNLKTVVVFPKITAGTGGADGGVAGVASLSLAGGSDNVAPIPEGSPEHMVTVSSVAVFEKMLKSKCPSWAQKKGCLAALVCSKEIVEALDATLMSGTPLTDVEQDLYDAVPPGSLANKEAHVKKEMQTQVEEGKLTNLEKDILLHQNGERLGTLTLEIEESVREKKPKKTEKLKAMKEKAEARKKLLEDIVPKAPHRLRNEPEITKLRAELRPLQKMEDDTKGRLLSVKETATLARKDEILEEIEALEGASRGWFEDDEAFAVRLEASRATARAKDKQKATKKPAGASGSSRPKPATTWVTPGSKKPAWNQKKAAKKKPVGGGGVFAAMMALDSDSD